MNAASPGVIALFQPNEHYATQDEYLEALAEAMRPEYEAIVAAGLILQLDSPDLGLGRHMMYKGRTLWVELKAPNGSLRPAQLREHVRMYEAGQQVIVLWNVDAIEKLVGWARSFA